MTSTHTVTAIALAAAASFSVASAHASTLYDTGLLSFESKAQSMWGSGDAFRKAESVFVGTNELITPKIPGELKTPAIPGYWTPAIPSKLLFPAVYSPAVPATYINIPPVKETVCLFGICETVTVTDGYSKQLTAYKAPELRSAAVYSPAIPSEYIPPVPAIYFPDLPAVYGDTRTGATIDVRSSGQVGLKFGYAIDSGSVDTTARFRPSALLPGTVKAGELFSVNASSVFDKGTITTQSPKIEAYITPVLKLSGTMDAKVCGSLLGCTTATNVALPTINLENQRLLSIDPNSLKILDGILPDGKALAEVPISNQTLTLEGGVTLLEPPVVGFKLSGPQGVTIATSLPPGPTVTAKVATVTTVVPNIATNGAANAAPVTSNGRSDLLTAKIDLDAVAAGRGLIPPTGAGFDLIDTPVFKLQVSGDLIDAEAGPVLGVTQKFTFTPKLMATINFSRGVEILGKKGLQDSWTGEWNELPQFAIDGTTTFTPTFWLDAMLTNEFGLDLGLIGTYDVLKIGATAKAGPFDVLRFNAQSLNRALGLGNTMFETDKLSFSVYDDTFDLEGFQAIAGQSFTVAVPEPSTYAMLLLGLGALGATARRRTRRQQDTPVAPRC